MSIPSLTEEELINTLKKSSLNTILVEGSFDMSIVRRLEEKFNLYGINFMPAGNKSLVLNIFRRKSEIDNIQLGFWVDRDLWIIDGVPEEFKDIIITKGYSIENDIIEDGYNMISNLMTSEEKLLFQSIVEYLIIWFVKQIQLVKNNIQSNFDESPMKFLEKKNNCIVIKSSYNDKLEENTCDQALLIKIKENPILHVRGKNFLSGIVMILSASDRTSKFSKENIIDVSLSSEGSNSKNLVNRIQKVFDNTA